MRSRACGPTVGASGAGVADEAGGVDADRAPSQERGRGPARSACGRSGAGSRAAAVTAASGAGRAPGRRVHRLDRAAGTPSANRGAWPGSASRSPRSRRRSARRRGRHRRAPTGAERGTRRWPRRRCARRRDPSRACDSGAAAASAGKRSASATSSEIMSNGRGVRTQLGCSAPSASTSRGTTAATRGSANAAATSATLPVSASMSGFSRSTTSARERRDRLVHGGGVAAIAAVRDDRRRRRRPRGRHRSAPSPGELSTTIMPASGRPGRGRPRSCARSAVRCGS